MSGIYDLTKKLVAELNRLNASGAGPYSKQYLKELVCKYIDEL
jgi:hypothetical protein